ncbi:hypothetical protein WJX72_010636 [[Myrmecia] bisecta]|uniref:Uncharacterized protein n=1 Tax=[Myrmecia] bisecta TaxID=41462 RepID=A0AAW1Q747_9CHLO
MAPPKMKELLARKLHEDRTGRPAKAPSKEDRTKMVLTFVKFYQVQEDKKRARRPSDIKLDDEWYEIHTEAPVMCPLKYITKEASNDLFPLADDLVDLATYPYDDEMCAVDLEWQNVSWRFEVYVTHMAFTDVQILPASGSYNKATAKNKDDEL